MNKAQKRSASHAGFHFINLFQNCERKGFFRYVARLQPKTQGQQLVFGAAFHEGKGTYYKTGSVMKAKNRAKKEIDELKDSISYDDYDVVSYKVPILLERWIRHFGEKDRENYEFFMVEEEILLTVPGTDFVVSARPDAVVRAKGSKTKQLIVMETKTSQSSIQLTIDGVELGDQATMYTWAVRSQYPGFRVVVQPDIAYWNKKTMNLDNVQFMRPDLVVRTDRDIKEFYEGLGFLHTRLTQQVEAFKTGKFKAAELFPRNTYYCNAYFKRCEYAEICRNRDVPLKGKPPKGFVRIPGRRSLLDPTGD